MLTAESEDGGGDVFREVIASNVLFMHESVDDHVTLDHAVLELIVEDGVVLVHSPDEYREVID